jgi:hypothetical protein
MVQQAYMLHGPCLCIFSKVQDSQKILTLENEALQKAWAVLLIALKTYSSVPPPLAAPRYRNPSTDIAGSDSKIVIRIVAR